MITPPQIMEIELEEEDVRGDLPKIVNSMSQIRSEAIKDQVSSSKKKDEYLHLTYRLASGIKGVAEGTMIKKMQVIADALTRNKELSYYDPLQDMHWQGKEEKFARALDDLLIGVVRDDFHDNSAKHHVLQAVKYLGVEEAPSNEREEVYNTILPFHGAVRLGENEGLTQKISNFFFGNSWNARTLDDLTLKIDGESGNFIEELVLFAKERGYTSIEANIFSKEYERIKGKLPGSEVKGEIKNVWKNTDFYDKAIKKTKYVSHLILGALPRSIQERFGERLEGYDMKKVMNYSTNVEVYGSFILGVSSAFVIWSLWPIIPLFAGGIDGFGRSSDSYNSEKFIHPVGSMFLKPFFYPLELYLNNRDKKRGKNVLNVKIPVREITPPKQIPNSSEFYDEIARLEVPEDVERSLVWDTDNHHSFGIEFENFVAEQVKEICLPGTSIERDRKNNCLTYSHELPVEGFRKNCSLFCLDKGKRYLVTAITRDNEENSFNENVVETLREDGTTNEKATQIGNRLNAIYMHLREYQSGEMVNDLEGFG